MTENLTYLIVQYHHDVPQSAVPGEDAILGAQAMNNRPGKNPGYRYEAARVLPNGEAVPL
jgi:hypothetical protein